LTRISTLVLAIATGCLLVSSAGADVARLSTLSGQKGTLWVVNRGGDTVTSYVGSTGKVLATISVGRVPNSVVVAPGTDKAYVTNEVSNTVSVISTMTREVIKTIKVPSDPHHIRTSRDGRRLYVSEYATNKVAVINTSTDSVVAEYATNPNSAARNHSSWITRDRKTLYLVNEGVNEVTAVDARSGDRIFSLAVGNKPSEIIVAPNGKRAYVSIRGSENKIRAINLTGRRLAGEVSLGQQPDTLQLTPDGKLLLVGMRGSPAELDIIAAPSLTFVATVTVAEAGTIAGHNWISANGRYSFITYEGGSAPGVAVVDHRAGHRVVATYTYPGGGRPHGIYYDDPAEIEGPAVLISPRATATVHAIPIRIACAAQAVGFCRGHVTLDALGSAGFSVSVGRVAHVQLKLSKKALSRLLSAKRLRVRATAVAHDQLGNSRATTTFVTVSAPR
jgi:YVTN family beta-propeller protein